MCRAMRFSAAPIERGIYGDRWSLVRLPVFKTGVDGE